jgi:nucleotide-binding universal stress UspA family protein
MGDVSASSLVIRNIAVATDFAPWSDLATQHALFVARRFGAVLHFIHAVRRSEFVLVPDLMVPIHEIAQRDCENRMGLLRASHSLDGIEHHCWNIDGECSEIFAEFVRDRAIDLLVLATRGRSGMSKFFLGSIAEEIARRVPCPVLAIGPQARHADRSLEVKKVLFATDLSSQASTAIPYVLMAAKAWQASIDVLPLCSSADPRRQQAMDVFSRNPELLAVGKHELSVRSHPEMGEPLATVLDFARQNQQDLIVLALDHHRSPHWGTLPSRIYEIVRHARCPVLSVH